MVLCPPRHMHGCFGSSGLHTMAHHRRTTPTSTNVWVLRFISRSAHVVCNGSPPSSDHKRDVSGYCASPPLQTSAHHYYPERHLAPRFLSGMSVCERVCVCVCASERISDACACGGLHCASVAQGLQWCCSPKFIAGEPETTLQVCRSTFGEGASGTVKTGGGHTPIPSPTSPLFDTQSPLLYL